MERRCPHPDIRFCPLYHAAHGGKEFGGAHGCVDALCGQYGCAVDEGRLDYRDAMEKLRRCAPRYAAELAFREAAEQSAEQRARNMRLSGVH